MQNLFQYYVFQHFSIRLDQGNVQNVWIKKHMDAIST